MNLSYKPGSLWRTRKSILAIILDDSSPNRSYSYYNIPYGEVIMLLSYHITPTFEESIQLLYKEKIYFALDLNIGLDLKPIANTGRQPQ